MSPQRISNSGRRAGALFAALLAVLLVAATAPVSALAVGSISGTVTRASDAEPVADLEVCAWGLGGEETFECAETDSAGTYTIGGLAAGGYEVEFWVPRDVNLIREFYDGKLRWGEGDPVEVEDGVDTAGIDAALEEGGWIEGRVIDAAGKLGVGEVFVCALPLDEVGTSRCAETAADGTYSILGLAADDYEVGFFPEAGGYLEQFYATPVGVTAGAGTDEIDAELTRGGTITGTVTDSLSGAGIAFSVLCLLEPFEGEIFDCYETGPNGRYTIAGLPVGTYKVWFSPDVPGWELADDYLQQFYDAKPLFTQAGPIGVGPGTVVPGINARLVSRKAPVSLSPAALPPAVTPPLSLKPKPQIKKCRKGKRKVMRKGKVRCVPKRKSQRRGAGRR